MASDERLVAHVRAGSEAAFEVLYDRHHRGILGFCRHMLGSVEEAEDALQHTFMAAYRDLVRADKPIQLRAWLYTIARNRCLTTLRARRERPLGEADEVPTENLASEVERRQDLRDLLSDLSGLPVDQRAALVLAELGAVSHDEIATVLDVPREKVKALVFQARTSLIASRKARDTPCQEIREQLASLRGGALRRTTLRRHLRECPGCRAFQAEVVAQRRALAVALPVLPTLGLKQTALAAAFGSGSAGGGAAAAAAGGGGALAAKALVAVALVGGGTTAAVTTTRHFAAPDRPAAHSAAPAASHRASVPGGAPRAAAPVALGERDGAGADENRVLARRHVPRPAARRSHEHAAARGKKPARSKPREQAPGPAAAKVRSERNDQGRHTGHDKPEHAAKRVKPLKVVVPKPVKVHKAPKPEPAAAVPAPVPAPTVAPTDGSGSSGLGHGQRGSDGHQDSGKQD
jgi:RNA polymerase sigma factor (sigma-70 family)